MRVYKISKPENKKLPIKPSGGYYTNEFNLTDFIASLL